MEEQLLLKSPSLSSPPPLEELYTLKPKGWFDAQFQILYEGYKTKLTPEDIYKRIQAMGYNVTIDDINKVVQEITLTTGNLDNQPNIKNESVELPTKKRQSQKSGCPVSPDNQRRLRNRDVQAYEGPNKVQQTRRTLAASFETSSRKIRPQNPSQMCGVYDADERIQSIQYRQVQCISPPQQSRKANKRTFQHVSKITTDTWVERQFFLANFDQLYYSLNDFVTVTKEVFQKIQKQNKLIRYSDFKIIQSAFGKMPLISKEFFAKEREILEHHRELLRNFSKHKNSRSLPNLMNLSYFTKFQKMTPLTITRPIVAFHPVCWHLHEGSIMALFKDNQVIVKFLNPHLGAYKVQDHLVSSDYEYLYRKMPNIKTLTVDNIKKMDYLATIAQFKLLQIKNNLIYNLKSLGRELERLKINRSVPSEELKGRYGYTGFIIQLIDLMLKYLFKIGRSRCNYTKKQALNTLTIGGGNFITIIQRQLEGGMTYQKEEDIDDRSLKMLGQQNAIDQFVGELWKQTSKNQIYLEEQDTIKSMLSYLMCSKYFPELLVSSEVPNKYLMSVFESLQSKQYTQTLYRNLQSCYNDN